MSDWVAQGKTRLQNKNKSTRGENRTTASTDERGGSDRWFSFCSIIYHSDLEKRSGFDFLSAADISALIVSRNSHKLIDWTVRFSRLYNFIMHHRESDGALQSNFRVSDFLRRQFQRYGTTVSDSETMPVHHDPLLCYEYLLPYIYFFIAILTSPKRSPFFFWRRGDALSIPVRRRRQAISFLVMSDCE